MSNFDTTTQFEEQNILLRKAKAVLSEVMEDCEFIPEPGTWEAAHFIKNLDHLGLLLYVVNDYIGELDKEQLNAVAEYAAAMKAEKEAKNAKETR
ncbi:hypothetical protein LJC74_04650 [Eubacteriales bacterium OttesenSCG-928-A19]|nr:hypothetical protein [Eubacteriales bacterium OttesenSCG-928-A19]